MIGFRNRFSVFREWAWTYLTFQDSARLITGSQILPGWDMRDQDKGTLTTVPLDDKLAEKPLDMGSPKS